MNWLKIDEHKDIRLERGSLLKLPTSSPSGGEVVMLVCDSPRGKLQLGLIPITGDKAGHNYFVMFPEDLLYKSRFITAGMVYDNWDEWIGPDYLRESAFILREGLGAQDLAGIRHHSIIDSSSDIRRINWAKLSENKEIALSRGSLVRFSASYPFEDEVVMMLCNSARRERAIGLITISGYKAGFNCYTTFPEQVRNADGSITAGLIYDNWATWIWPDWSPDSAWILQGGLRVEDLQ